MWRLFSTLPSSTDRPFKNVSGFTNQEANTFGDVSAMVELFDKPPSNKQQAMVTARHHWFWTYTHATSANGGEANSDGDKRDVKQR